MLATLVREPFTSPAGFTKKNMMATEFWLTKKVLAVRLYSRNAIDRTDRFPDIAKAMSALRPSTLLLDGEVSVFDRAGVSRFQLLQNLGTAKSVFAIFDCLLKMVRTSPGLNPVALEILRTILERSYRPQ